MSYTRDNVKDVSEWGWYRKIQDTKAKRIQGYFECETKEGPMSCPDGWLAIDAEGYPYPIANSVFEATYREI